MSPRARQALWLPLVLCGAALAACKGTTIVKVGDQVDTFTQGGQTIQTETLNQRPAIIDILFVITDSPSMCAKQQRLAGDFAGFITQLQSAGLDFHIGIVTADFTYQKFDGQLVQDSSGQRYLTSQTQNLTQAFAAIVQNVGYTGGVDSEPLLAAAAALQTPLSTGVNAGFLRTGASLAIIVVDDQDDYSLTLPWTYAGYDAGVPFTASADGGIPDGGQSGDPTALYFARVLKSLKGAGEDGLVTVSAIVGANPLAQNGDAPPDYCNVVDAGPTTCPAPVDDSADPAFRTLQVVSATGGLGQSICQPSFAGILTNISQLLGGLNHQFPLEPPGAGQVFQASSLGISVALPGGKATPVPQSSTDGWTLSGSTITFNGASIPPAGAQILVTYGTLQNTFKLTYTPETGTLTVTLTVNGQTATAPSDQTDPTNGYHYDSTQNAIVFPPGNLPALGAIITASYQVQG